MRRITLAVAALLLSAACTPEQAVWLHFHTNGSPGLHAQAQRVVACESRWDPNAVSRTGDHGLFQINERTWNKPGHHDPVADWIGRHWHRRFEPIVNAHMAKLIYDAYGWGMWSCRP